MHKCAKFRQIGDAKQLVYDFFKKTIEMKTRYEINYY